MRQEPGRPAAGAAPPQLDFRLAPSALGAWGATFVAVAAGPVAAWWLAAVTAVGGLWALGGAGAFRAAARRKRPCGQVVWRPVAVTVGAALAVTACFSVAGALRAGAAADNPARQAAEHRAPAQATVVVTMDPGEIRAQAGPGGRARTVLVRARLTTLDLPADGGQRWAVGGAVVVLAPAASWEGLVPGQHVRVNGTLQPPRRSDLTVAVIITRAPPELLGTPPAHQRAASAVRQRFADSAARVLPPDKAGLLPGIVVGDESRMPQHVEDNFTAAGLAHLTAVSGSNVTIICGAVLLVLRLCGCGPRLSAGFAALALAGFVVLARPSASVLRAAAMGSVGLLALVARRRKQALPALATAVLVLLAVQPALAADYGFALSVVATAGLVLLGPVFADWLRGRGCPRGVAEALAVAAAAQAVTAPVVAMMSGQFSMVSVVANVLVAPVVGAATVVGVLGAGACLVWQPAGDALIWVAGVPVGWMLWVAQVLAELPGSTYTVPSGVAGGALLAGATVLLLVLASRPRVRPFLGAVVVGLALVWVPTRWATPGWPADEWAVAVCDVGQGDAVVLAAGGGAAVLVDAGPDPAAVDRCLSRLKVDTLAMVVLSHLHADHIAGLPGALRGRQVGAVLVGPGREPRSGWQQVRGDADARGVPLVQAAAGDAFDVGGLRLTVLAPGRANAAFLGQNDQSLVVAADTTAGRVLLTGDVEEAGQRLLLESGADLRADILKVPHHGAATTLPEFLEAVRPRIALVPVGAGNTYGHPHPRIVGQLEHGGATVLRTDTDGAFAVRGPASHPAAVMAGQAG